jgi:hypothetical protein
MYPLYYTPTKEHTRRIIPMAKVKRKVKDPTDPSRVPKLPKLRKRKVPDRFYERLGYMDIAKGSMGGEDDTEKRLFSWNAIMPCNHFCSVIEVCPFRNCRKPIVEDPVQDRDKGHDPRQVKCFVMVKYLKSVSSVILENFGEDLLESELLRVGMHLMPLYKNLCRLKIEEMGISLVVDTETGRISPIYREMRATIKDIEGLWNSLGLLELEKKLKRKIEIPDVDGIMEGNVTRTGMRAGK